MPQPNIHIYYISSIKGGAGKTTFSYALTLFIHKNCNIAQKKIILINLDPLQPKFSSSTKSVNGYSLQCINKSDEGQYILKEDSNKVADVYILSKNIKCNSEEEGGSRGSNSESNNSDKKCTKEDISSINGELHYYLFQGSIAFLLHIAKFIRKAVNEETDSDGNYYIIIDVGNIVFPYAKFIRKITKDIIKNKFNNKNNIKEYFILLKDIRIEKTLHEEECGIVNSAFKLESESIIDPIVISNFNNSNSDIIMFNNNKGNTFHISNVKSNAKDGQGVPRILSIAHTIAVEMRKYQRIRSMFCGSGGG